MRIASRKWPPRTERSLAYLDHDADDRTSVRFCEAARLPAPERCHFVGDVYAILDGVALGLGRAVVPKHLVDERHRVRPRHVQRTEVYLHWYREAMGARVHRAVRDALLVRGRRRLERTDAGK